MCFFNTSGLQRAFFPITYKTIECLRVRIHAVIHIELNCIEYTIQ